MTLQIVGVDLPVYIAETVARLADEGLPVCAIARSMKLPSDSIREVLHEAIATGGIVEYPREDWPPGVPRNKRGQITEGLLNHEDRLRFACVRHFKTTKLQSAILAIMLKRTEVTKEQLHQVIEQNRANEKEETDLKMVDVIVCHLRKKLKPFGIAIKTVWACGYFIEIEHRDRALKLLEDFLATAEELKEVA